MTRKCKSLSLIFSGIVLSIDQWTKALIWDFHSGLPFSVTNFFDLVFVQNKGVTFGFLQADSFPARLILIGLALFLSLIVGWWLYRAEKTSASLGYALILGGALGNLIDRIRFGAVTDFLDFHIHGYHWPAFNVADSAIVLGVGLILLTQSWQVKP